MKKQLLLSTTLLLAIVLHAQNEQPVVIVSTTGKVALISKGKSKARPVQAGAVAQTTSQIKLGEGATATVYCGGQFKTVKGAQTVELPSICVAKTGSRALDADYYFGEKLIAAVQMVAVAKSQGAGWSNAISDPKKSGDGWGNAISDPKKSGDGWGNAISDPKKSGDGWSNAISDPKKSGDGWGNAISDPKKSGDGWGGKGASIRLILPKGKVSAMNTTFSWSRPKTSAPYQLEILNENNKTVHSVSVKDTSTVLDLKVLNLASDQLYTWKVSVSGGEPMVSNELELSIGSEEELKTILKEAASTELSQTTQSPALHSLIEAVALEESGWNYAAAQTYATLAQQRKPDNLVRMMHAAFWMRLGFRRLSEKAGRGWN